MLNLNVDSFMVEFKEGRIRTVGAPDKSAEAKLFDVDDATARPFGDSQVKLVATDDEGNEVQVALSPQQATSVREDLATLEAEGDVFE